MYNMAGTVEETIQGCSAFSPSHVDFRLRKTAWGNGARNTKIIYNYKWQSRSLGAKEFRGPALSIPPSPTFSYPIWMTAWKVGGWSGEKSIRIPSLHMHPIKFIRRSPWAKCLAYQDLWEGKRGLRISLSWTVSSHPGPLYHNEQVALSKTQAKQVITRLKMLANCNPFLHAFMNQHCCFSSNRCRVTELQEGRDFCAPFRFLTTCPSVLQLEFSPKNLLLQPCCSTKP